MYTSIFKNIFFLSVTVEVGQEDLFAALLLTKDLARKYSEVIAKTLFSLYQLKYVYSK